MYRSNMCLLSSALQSLVCLASGCSDYHRSQDYINEQKDLLMEKINSDLSAASNEQLPFNAELVDKMYPYMQAASICLAILRAIRFIHNFLFKHL